MSFGPAVRPLDRVPTTTRARLNLVPALLRPSPADDYRVTMAKVAVWLQGLAALLALAATAVPPTHVRLIEQVAILCCLGLVSSLPILRFPWQRFHQRLFLIVSSLDIVLIAAGVAASGGTASRYQPLYVLVVIFGAYFYPVPETTALTVATALAYVAPFLYTRHPHPEAGPTSFMMLGVFALVAAATKATALHLQRERALRDAAESELNRLYMAELERTQALERKTRQLEGILETGNAFRLQLGLDALLTRIASAICETGGFRAAVLRLFNPVTGEAECRAVYGVEWEKVEPPTPPTFIAQLLDPKWQISRSFLVELRPEMFENPETGPYLYVMPGERPVGAEWKPEHALIVPLETREHGMIGIISVDEPHDGRIPSFDTIQTLEIFANLAATAIDNARLLEEASEAKALRELDRIKSEFLATVSHDLRTPITVIKGSAELLQEPEAGALSPLQARLLENIRRNTDSLAGIVEQILDMVRLEENRVKIKPEPVDISALVSEAAEALLPLLHGRGQSIEVDDQLNGCIVSIDRHRIRQVLSNLIINASKYGPEDAPISIHVEDSGPNVLVCVHDEGGNISIAEQARIFEKFYRAPVEGGVREGIGLGLAICRAFVELHGGHITVDSHPRRGTTFEFTLPKTGNAG